MVSDTRHIRLFESRHGSNMQDFRFLESNMDTESPIYVLYKCCSRVMIWCVSYTDMELILKCPCFKRSTHIHKPKPMNKGHGYMTQHRHHIRKTLDKGTLTQGWLNFSPWNHNCVGCQNFLEIPHTRIRYFSIVSLILYFYFLSLDTSQALSRNIFYIFHSLLFQFTCFRFFVWFHFSIKGLYFDGLGLSKVDLYKTKISLELSLYEKWDALGCSI